MSQGESNAQWLFDNMPRARYAAHGTRRQEGVKIVAGLARIAASKKSYGSDEVYFGNFFSSGCNPIVTTGTVSSHQRRIHVTLNGIGRLHPDHRGFRVHVSMDNNNKKKNNITRSFYVAWQALGY